MASQAKVNINIKHHQAVCIQNLCPCHNLNPLMIVTIAKLGTNISLIKDVQRKKAMPNYSIFICSAVMPHISFFIRNSYSHNNLKLFKIFS